MSSYRIYRVVVSDMKTNCYIVKPYDSPEALVVDPGGDAELIKNKLREVGAYCGLILLTHGHFDHILAVDELRTPLTKVMIHKADEHYLYEKDYFSDMIAHDPRPLMKADIIINGSGRYVHNAFDMTFIHTPGHTNGSICTIIDDYMFTGDTLFKGSIGTTVFGGNDEDMRNTLKNLYYFPGDYEILPGHNDITDLSSERETNPYFAEFVK